MFEEQIGLPGTQTLMKQQLAESGLEMQWLGAAIGGITSLVTGGMAANSKQNSANKQVQINYEMAKDNWKYENEMADRQVEFAQEGVAIQRKNNIRNAKWQDQTNLKNWQLGIEQSDFKFVNQLMAKMESDKTLQKNLNFNNKAYDHAMRQQDNWMRDKEIARDFALEDMGLMVGKAEDSMTGAYNEILNTAAKERQGIYHNMNMVQMDRNIKRMDIAFKSQDNAVDALIAAGKAQNQQAGRSSDKSIQAAQMAGGRKEAELTQQATNIFKLAALSMDNLHQNLFYINNEAEDRAESVGKQYINTMKEANLDKWKISETWLSAKRQDIINREEIGLSKEQQDMNAWANNMLMPMRGPVPPPPFATPLPDLQDPLDHVWSPKPMKGATQSGAVMGAIAGSLTGIGGALDTAFKD